MANFGPFELCKLFIEKGAGEEQFDVGNHGLRSMHYAAGFNRVDVLQLLLEKTDQDIEIATEGGETPLYLASSYGSLGRSNSFSAEATAIVSGFTPLHCFVECNHRNVAEVLLAAGAKVNLRTPGTAESPETKHSRAGATAVRPVLNVSTALHQATAYNDPDPMKLLLKYGADINATTDQAEHTPLPLAIMFGCSDAVALLLEKGANIEVYAVGPPEGTPLIYAIK